MIYVDKSRVRLRFFLSPGKYDVVCSAHNDISSPIKDIGFSECRDYYVRCLPVLIQCPNFKVDLNTPQP